jgi:hypothetical protein
MGHTELRPNGVLRSSQHVSNPKQRQRYDVWGMYQKAHSCYRASQQRSEALKYAPNNVGTHGTCGASGATGYRTTCKEVAPMRRIVFMVTVALVLLLITAVPVFADEGGAVVEKYGNCSTGTGLTGECHLVLTPSGNKNLWAHAHPRSTGPAAGGGASHELQRTDCITPQPAKGVITPSGNVNVHCTGQP